MNDQTVDAIFEAGHSKEDKISAVHFVQFRPLPIWIDALKTLTSQVFMVINHKQYKAKQEVSEAMRLEWLTDLGENQT